MWLIWLVFLPSLFIFFLMNLNKTCSVTALESSKKKESRKNPKEVILCLLINFTLESTSRALNPRGAIHLLLLSLSHEREFSLQKWMLLPIYQLMYPHSLSVPLYTCKESKCNPPQKGLVLVSRDRNPIKLIIVLQIFLAGCPFNAIFALKVQVLDYIMIYKLNAISNLNLYKCQLPSYPVSPRRLPRAQLESVLLCRHCITYSKKLLLEALWLMNLIYCWYCTVQWIQT